MPGDLLKYTIYFNNLSATNMFNVTIRDQLPATVTLIEGSINPKPKTGETLKTGINIGTVPAGKSRTLEYTVKVNANAQTSIVNKANSTYKFKDWRGKEYSKVTNEANVVVLLSNADIEITKTANKNYVTQEDRILTYTLTISNTGKIKLENLFILDSLPEGMEYIENSTYLDDSKVPCNKNPAEGITITELLIGKTYKIVFSCEIK